LFVELEAEVNLVVKVLALGDIERVGILRVELLGDGLGGVVEVLQKVGGDGQVVTAGKLDDLASVTEGSTHDNGVVVVLLVVVEDVLDGLDTGVLLSSVIALVSSLVPVKDAADEGRDQEGTGLSSSDSLDQGEHQGQVAVDAVLGLEDVSGLDTLVGGGDLDEDALLLDADLLVELVEETKLIHAQKIATRAISTYLDDLKGLVDGGLGVKGQPGVDFSGDLAGNDLENLLAELDEETVEGGLNLNVDGATLLLAVGHGSVDKSGILWLLGRSQDQGGVGGGILGLVLADGCGTLAIFQPIATRGGIR
jgi:hypothetical protein